MRSVAIQVASAVYGVSVLLAAVVLGFFVGSPVLLFAWLPRGRRERYTIVPAVVWSRLVVRWLLLVDDRVDGEPALPKGEGAVIVCNHRSWLDPLLLMFRLRSNGLSKAEIFWIPVLGLYGWLAGAVFFDRHAKGDRSRARREVLSLVRSGHRLQVFPEGTRSRTGELGDRIYLTIPMDCFKDGLPVQCCAVWGTERVLPPGHFGAWPRQQVRLRIGKTLHPRDYRDARRFAQACWDEVVTMVNALRTEEEGRCPERDSNPHSAEGRGF